MVKKLIKYELLSYFRSVWPITITAAALTLIAALMYYTYQYAVFVFLSWSLFVLMFYVFIAVILGGIAKRFRKSMFSEEGYMTFSIPATSAQLIFAKMVAAFLLWLYAILLFLICSVIFSLIAGNASYDKEVLYWKIILEELVYSAQSNGLLFFENIVYFFALSVFFIIYLFMGICFGQLFQSRKNLMTVLFFIILFYLFTLLYPHLYKVIDLLYRLNKHVSMLVKIIFFMLLSVTCFFIVRYFISRRLNLTA